MLDPIRPLHTDHHKLDVAGVHIHFVTAGDPGNPPVLLLHGWPQTWEAWRRLMPLLAKNFYVVAPDLPGLGESSFPLPDYSKKAIADLLHVLLDEFLEERRYHLVGHDWGGPVAFYLAASNRAATRTLSILDVTVPGNARAAGAISIGAKWHIAFNMVPGLAEALTEGREQAYISWYFENYCATEGALAGSIDSYIEAYTRPGAMRSGLEYYRTVNRDAAVTNAIREEGPLEMPVLAVGGGESWGPEVGLMLASLAVNVCSEVLPGCGHFIPEERPQETAKLLQEHFARD